MSILRLLLQHVIVPITLQLLWSKNIIVTSGAIVRYLEFEYCMIFRTLPRFFEKFKQQGRVEVKFRWQETKSGKILFFFFLKKKVPAGYCIEIKLHEKDIKRQTTEANKIRKQDCLAKFPGVGTDYICMPSKNIFFYKNLVNSVYYS